MTYVMSDLHGCYHHYIKMLEKIEFSSSDVLYLIGDVVDRGKDGIKILLDCINRTNVKLIMGNHEYIMAVLLSNMKLPIGRATALEDKMFQGLNLWIDDGGQPTFRDFIDLSEDEQKKITSFLVKLPLYMEVTINDKNYVLVHSGFDNFSLSRKLKDYKADELLFRRHSLEQIYFNDKIVIVGHTPTFEYGDKNTGKIVYANNIINIDCGCVYAKSEILGCLRIEDGNEFYIK